MKKVFRYLTMMLAIGSLTLTSCLDEEEIVNNQKEQYQDNWVKVFGNIDPDHDWSVAKQVNATFNLTGVVSGEHTARIYTEHPFNKKCKLLAEFKVNGNGTVSFDTEKTTKHVYIRVENNEGQMAFDGYFTIEGNQLVADSRTIAGRSLSRATAPNNAYFSAHNIGEVKRDGQNEEKEIGQSATETVDLGTIYYPNTQITSSGKARIGFNDYLIPIINNSSTAIFQEFKDNRTKTSTKGVEYVTITDGEVQLDYVFGMTGLYNTIGYFYWNPDNGQTYADAPKIVLLEDAEPDKILGGVFYENGEQKEIAFSSIASENNQYGMVLNQYIRGDKTPPTELIGQSYKLLYYGEDYQSAGITNFPAGTHIGFFLYTNYWDTSRTSNNSGSPYPSLGDYAYGRQNPKEVENNNQYRTNLVYSIPAYNQAIKESYNYRINESEYSQQNGNTNYNVDVNTGEISAVTYNYQGKTILGFEDGVDKDMNDILFVVNANVEVAGGEVVDLGGTTNTPQAQSWIIACEDLGSVGDYDFNDAVFSVSHVGGSTSLTVTPLAAGGTYPIKLLYNGQQVGSNDFHLLIDGNASKDGDLWKPINADTKGTAGQSITISNVPENYSINQHGFSVEVEKNEGTSITIKQSMANDKEQKAPQMLILPGNWIWPKESKPIHSGYPRFASWNADQQQHTDWYTNNNEFNDIAESNLVGSYGSQGGAGGEQIPDIEEPTATKYSIDVTVDQESKGTIQTDNNGNDYLELPKDYFASSGNTQIVISGISETGNSIALQRVSDNNQLAWTSSNTMTVDASQVTGAVRIYIWQNSTDNFSKVTGVTITNNYQGNGGSEEPETPTIYWNYWTCYNESSDIYGIPLSKLEELSGSNGITITVTLEEGQTDQVGLFYNMNNVGGSVLINRNEQSANQIVITVTKDNITSWKNSDYEIIYTGLSNNGNTITNIAIEAVNSSSTPSTGGITFTVDGEKQEDLTLEGQLIRIPTSVFKGNNGATIYIDASETNYSAELKYIDGAQIIQGNMSSENTITADIVSAIKIHNEIGIYLYYNAEVVTGIRIENKNTEGGETGGETPTTVSIPITVNGTGQNALTATDGQFTIPLSQYGISSNGATITFEGGATVTINDIEYTTTYEVESSKYNQNIDVTIKSGTISKITITNKESTGGETGGGNNNGNVTQNGFPYYINGIQQNNITYNNDITINSSDFGEKGGTIKFYGNGVNIGFNNQSYTGNPVSIEITEDMVKNNNSFTFGFWCDASQVTKIEITTNK